MPLQNLPKLWAIWAKYLLPQALKSCPKCKISPNLVTLHAVDLLLTLPTRLLAFALSTFALLARRRRTRSVAKFLNRLHDLNKLGSCL